MKQKRAIIIFDASNFYFRLKSLQLKNKQYFDYSKFSRFIAADTQLIAKYYAVGKLEAKPTDPPPVQRMMANQQEIIGRLEKHGFIIQLGYLLKSEGSFHEKGVDIYLAIDIIKGAFLNTYDICYLVSSDTDLLPAIWEAQQAGKQVVYVGFRHQLSYAMHHHCSQSRILEKAEVLKFL
jgi:uncharacterized LabA/DUF88 family protein